MDLHKTDLKTQETADDASRLLVHLAVQRESIFHFPEGVPAFESAKEFIFLSKPDTPPFFFMQAIEPADLSFVCVDPFRVCPNYKLDLSDTDTEFLGLQCPEDAFAAAIVTVAPDPSDITANLQGPVVVNMRARIGKQVVCDGGDYPVRYRLWDALGRFESETRARREISHAHMEHPG